MFTNASKYIKDFEKNSKDNPLHESLLTYLKINTINGKRDVKYLVDYMRKNHMLEDNMCYIYVRFLFDGTCFQKDFRQLVKEVDNGRTTSSCVHVHHDRGTTNGKSVAKEEYIKSLCDDDEEEADIESFLAATHYVDWNYVRKGKKAYIFEPEFGDFKIKPLQLKPEGIPLLDVSNLEQFYKWLPAVRYRIDRKFNI